jgi:hypothetical protein
MLTDKHLYKESTNALAYLVIPFVNVVEEILQEPVMYLTHVEPVDLPRDRL